MITEQKSGKAGVLLINIGTPDAPTKKALRPYLREFLSDPRVVDLPRWKWLPILHLIILNTRPKRSAAAYAKIWTDEGSPLLVIGRRLAEGIEQKLHSIGLDDIIVDTAMRYGRPSIKEKLVEMKSKGVEQLLIVPMYPQYSDATTASTFDGVAKALEKQRFIPEVRMLRSWHDDSAYIHALANSVKKHFAEHGKPDKLLVSYHGIPKRYLLEGDPYFCQCHKTTRLMADILQLQEDDYIMVFQSHFGKEEWLKPYADETIEALPTEGVKNVAVVCPGFSIDCLETLEEMAMDNKEEFIAAGGETYTYVPCLNDTEEHISLLTDLIRKHGQGWGQFEGIDCSIDSEQATRLTEDWEKKEDSLE